jgi:hypothetical protein
VIGFFFSRIRLIAREEDKTRIYAYKQLVLYDQVAAMFLTFVRTISVIELFTSDSVLGSFSRIVINGITAPNLTNVEIASNSVYSHEYLEIFT